MPALPRFLRGTIKATFCFLLAAFLLSSLAGRSSAQSPPNPQPCTDPVQTDKLTRNILPATERTVTASGTQGSSVTVRTTFTYEIDFSELQAIFGSANSNYWEGKYQDTDHAQANIAAFSSKEFVSYHGVEQKTMPKVLTDELKQKYVDYVFNKPTLPEAATEYTDTKNTADSAMTVYDMMQEFGDPQPPSLGGDKVNWSNTWGKYWDKLPTAVNEIYQGQIIFRAANKRSTIDGINQGLSCPPDDLRTIFYVMPDFFRTQYLSDQTNMTLVPKAAQSTENNNFITKAVNGTKNAVSGVFQKCIEAATDNPVTKGLKKVIKISLENLKPIKTANAQAPPQPSCAVPIAPNKQGLAPYCALPSDQLRLGDECRDALTDDNQLDPSNTNVICEFAIEWSKTLTIGEGDFDSCSDSNGDGVFNCSVTVAVWPHFYVPFLAEIWNNSLYSDEKEQGHTNSLQETGRPGFYSFFTPSVVFESAADFLIASCKPEIDPESQYCNELLDYANEVFPQYPGFQACVEQDLFNRLRLVTCAKNFVAGIEKKLSGGPIDAKYKQKFSGGWDCGKEHVRDVALKPLELQKLYRTTNECVLTIQSSLFDRTGPPGPAPGPPFTLDYYIKYGDTSIEPFDKDAIIELANNAFPNNNTDRWDFVVSESERRGVSPAFAIAIWWEEGGFGGQLSSGRYAGSEFGCFPGGDTNQQVSFEQAFECFLDFTDDEHPYDSSQPQESFIEWATYFCGPDQSVVCGNNPNFLRNLKSVYNDVAPGEICTLNDDSC